MGFGLCVGGIGIGKCGNTSSDISNKITNTAIATAYYNSAFSCQNAISGGNRVVAGGICSCREAGVPGYQCLEYQEKVAELKQQICDKALEKGKDNGLSAEELTCLCKGGSCNLDINQKSIILSQVTCKNTSDVLNKLQNNFTNDLLAKLKQSMNDVGGLFDSNDQNVATTIANSIQQQFNTSLVADVANNVVTGNSVKADCGGLNMNITQYSYLNNVLNVLYKNKTIQSASNKLQNQLKESLDRQDKGFFGQLGGIITIIAICVTVGAVLICGIYFGVKAYKAKKGK